MSRAETGTVGNFPRTAHKWTAAASIVYTKDKQIIARVCSFNIVVHVAHTSTASCTMSTNKFTNIIQTHSKHSQHHSGTMVHSSPSPNLLEINNGIGEWLAGQTMKVHTDTNNYLQARSLKFIVKLISSFMHYLLNHQYCILCSLCYVSLISLLFIQLATVDNLWTWVDAQFTQL